MKAEGCARPTRIHTPALLGMSTSLGLAWASITPHPNMLHGVQEGQSVMHKFRLSEDNRQGPLRAVEVFVGGLWQHLQSLLLYTLPSPASAMRAQPGSFCGVHRHAYCTWK